jgi:methyl-accepting chemotaxis protein
MALASAGAAVALRRCVAWDGVAVGAREWVVRARLILAVGAGSGDGWRSIHRPRRLAAADVFPADRSEAFLRSITTKIIAATLAACGTLGLALGLFLVHANRAESERSVARLDRLLRDEFDLVARSQVQTAASLLEGVAALRDRGVLTGPQAQQVAADLLRGLRYGDEGYFWADTTDGVNVVLLGRDTEGKNRLEAVDARGNQYIRDLRARALEGGGFSDYWFPKKGGGAALPKRGYSKLVRAFGWVIGTGNYVDAIEAAVAREREAAETEAERKLRAVVAVIGGSLLLAAGLAVLLGRRLTRPILKLTTGLGRMAAGDFATRADLERLAAERDETGQMARALLAMRASLATMVEGTRSSAEAIAAASRQMEGTASRMGSGAAEQASAVQETMASMAEIAQTAARAKERAAAVMEATSRSETLATAGGEASAQVRAEIEALGAQVGAIAHATESLAGKALQIDAIAASAEDVAQQSHVLALNASLEAARAGEAGKGFAVVAAEVRQLAAQSLAASARVREIVKDIQAASRAAIGAAEEGSRRAGTAVGASRATDEAIGGLAAVIRDAVTEAREIAESVRQQSIGVDQVTQAMTEVSGVTATTVETARDVEAASSALANQSGALRASIAGYRTTTFES